MALASNLFNGLYSTIILIDAVKTDIIIEDVICLCGCIVMFRLTGHLQWTKGFSLTFRDNTQTLLDSSGRVIGPSQRPLPDNIHPDVIRTRNPSNPHALELATTGIGQYYHLLRLNVHIV